MRTFISMPEKTEETCFFVGRNHELGYLGHRRLVRDALGLRARAFEGFTKPVPNLLTVGGTIVSFGLLFHAFKTLP